MITMMKLMMMEMGKMMVAVTMRKIMMITLTKTSNRTTTMIVKRIMREVIIQSKMKEKVNNGDNDIDVDNA